MPILDRRRSFEEIVRTATVVARVPTKLLTLDYQRFRSFRLAFPEAMLALMKLTVKRLLDQPRERRVGH